MHRTSGATKDSLKTTSVARTTSYGPNSTTSERCSSEVQSSGKAPTPRTRPSPFFAFRATRVLSCASAASRSAPSFASTFFLSSGIASGWSVTMTFFAPSADATIPRSPQPAPSSTTSHRANLFPRAIARPSRARRRRYPARQNADSHTMPPQESCRLWSCRTRSSTVGPASSTSWSRLRFDTHFRPPAWSTPSAGT
eukprot:31201-Pelagococcus_subviridis.AAC.1